MPDPLPEAFDDTPPPPPSRPGAAAPMTHTRATEIALSTTLRLAADGGHALAGPVVAAVRLLGIVPLARPGVIPADALWPLWREAVAVLARELPQGTRAERARFRAVWATLEAADLEWEAR